MISGLITQDGTPPPDVIGTDSGARTGVQSSRGAPRKIILLLVIEDTRIKLFPHIHQEEGQALTLANLFRNMNRSHAALIAMESFHPKNLYMVATTRRLDGMKACKDTAAGFHNLCLLDGINECNTDLDLADNDNAGTYVRNLRANNPTWNQQSICIVCINKIADGIVCDNYSSLILVFLTCFRCQNSRP